MILLVGSYCDRDALRAAELAQCLSRNCENSSIEEVHVFLEDGGLPSLQHAKLRWLPLGRRLLYEDLFQYANRELRGRWVILANSDIYFDRSLTRLEGFDLSGRLLCLSRWDVHPDGSSRLFEFASSQDAWIFQAPLPPFPCDWHLGKPGCENRLAHEAERAGLILVNPARSIRAHHLHLSRVIRYAEPDRIPGPGRSIEPTFLGVPHLWYGDVAEAEPADGLCFSEEILAGDLAARALQTLDDGRFLSGTGGLICRKSAFDRAGGADQNISDRGQANADLRDRLRRAGMHEKVFPPLQGAPPQEVEPARTIDADYCRIKRAVLDATGGGASGTLLRELHRAVARRVLRELGVGPPLPCAQVAFRESMGYTLARLAPGVSSHNNDPRPIVSVPPPLAGRSFTQVVAYRVSPIEVRFLTAGKLYVLVGTDWDGYRFSVDWLRQHGFCENLPPLLTDRGTAFEVWSVIGVAGEEVVLPTQVMLVSDQLEQRA